MAQTIADRVYERAVKQGRISGGKFIIRLIDQHHNQMFCAKLHEQQCQESVDLLLLTAFNAATLYITLQMQPRGRSISALRDEYRSIGKNSGQDIAHDTSLLHAGELHVETLEWIGQASMIDT